MITHCLVTITTFSSRSLFRVKCPEARGAQFHEELLNLADRLRIKAEKALNMNDLATRYTDWSQDTVYSLLLEALRGRTIDVFIEHMYVRYSPSPHFEEVQ